ncbi:MAG: hypothetical protein AAFN41_07110 [Planctomycetota bacterium]
MAQDSSKAVKIVIIVLCLAGAAAGLYFAFAPSGGPVIPEGADEPITPAEQGIGDFTEEEVRERTSGA